MTALLKMDGAISVPVAKTRQESIEKALQEPIGTSVYCVWNIDRNAVKIGFSENPRRRFQQLKTACCDRLVLWGFYPGNRITESVLHETFKHLQMEGEWFDASDGLILKCMAEQTILMRGDLAYNG